MSKSKSRSRIALTVVAPLALSAWAFGCNEPAKAETPAAGSGSGSGHAAAAQPTPAPAEAHAGSGSGSGHHDGEGGVHLGNVMYELQRRWSAIWFAGKAGNAEMVKYQTHEIEEVVDGIRAAKPHEEGVDVVNRLDLHVIKQLEGIEEAVAKGDTADFEKRYLGVVAGCNGCHNETKHAFIKVQKPQYNPYPNLSFDK